MARDPSAPLEALEDEVRRLCDAGDLRSAATRALEGYGAELLGYLHALSRDETEAADAFSMFSEDLWRGLPGFRWESRLRTWAYTLARRALLRLRRDPHRRPGRFVSPSADIAERIKSSTLPHLRSSVQDRFAQLRRELEPDDQTLLILRIDRALPWIDVARVMSDDPADEPELSRRAAAVRKRFERLKKRIREELVRMRKDARFSASAIPAAGRGRPR